MGCRSVTTDAPAGCAPTGGLPSLTDSLRRQRCYGKCATEIQIRVPARQVVHTSKLGISVRPPHQLDANAWSVSIEPARQRDYRAARKHQTNERRQEHPVDMGGELLTGDLDWEALLDRERRGRRRWANQKIELSKNCIRCGGLGVRRLTLALVRPPSASSMAQVSPNPGMDPSHSFFCFL